MVRKILKWLGIVLGGLVGLLIVAAIVVYFVSESKVNAKYDAPQVSVTIPKDAASLERGKRLATIISACVDCHGANFGGSVFVDDPALGRIVAPNLTKGKNGVGGVLSDAEIARVLRYGVLPDGKSAKVMPADDYNNLSDEDLGAVIAYVRSVPPVDSDLPPTELRPIGRILTALDQLDIYIAKRIDFKKVQPKMVAAGVTKEYGTYLGNIAGCVGCHGPGLSGGVIPGTPPDWPKAANLTDPKIKQWSEADFIKTIRTGKDPSGHELVDEMPWKTYRNMTDDELKAIWIFVQGAPPRLAGTR